MPRTVTVGLDGSAESRAAAEWAAREAQLLGLPLKLVQVWEPVPPAMAEAPLLGAEAQRHWTERIPRETARGTPAAPSRPRRDRRTAVRPARRRTGGRPEGRGAARSRLPRHWAGSAGSWSARSGCPSWRMRTGPSCSSAPGSRPPTSTRWIRSAFPSAATPFRPVVLGLDIEHPDDATDRLRVRRRRPPRHLPARRARLEPAAPTTPTACPSTSNCTAPWRCSKPTALTEVLRPWRQKFPAIEVTEESRYGSPANHLVDASRTASLVVVGRRVRRSPLGAHIGSVTHAVLHHSTAPVAVVSHG